MQKNEVGTLPYTIYKNGLKMNQRPKITKFLEESIEENIVTLYLAKILRRTTKVKIDKVDCIRV